MESLNEKCEQGFNLFYQEKILLVSVIMYAGMDGLNEFEKEMKNKIINGDGDYCMSQQSMTNVMQQSGMPDKMIRVLLLQLMMA